MTIQADAQGAIPGTDIELYDLDLTALGGPIFYFTRMVHPTDPVITWRGHPYVPIPVSITGFEKSAKGALPQPKLQVSNLDITVLMGVVKEYQDLLGATVTRWRTYSQYLDGQPMADPDAHFHPDIFQVEQKTNQDESTIEWLLSASIDQQGKLLPGRQILRDVCTHRYRLPVLGSFDYTKATCPYTGSACFDFMGVGSTQDNDQCGKRLSDCKLRFGNDPLPYQGFPGVARVRLA